MEVRLSPGEERGVVQLRVNNANQMLKHKLGQYLSNPTDERMAQLSSHAITYRKRFRECEQYDRDRMAEMHKQ